jgi:hypothetical protein
MWVLFDYYYYKFFIFYYSYLRTETYVALIKYVVKHQQKFDWILNLSSNQVMIIYKKYVYQFAHDYLGPPNWSICPFKLILVNELWECNNSLNLCQKRKRIKNVTINSLLDTLFFCYCYFIVFFPGSF